MIQQCANCSKDVSVPPSKAARGHRAYCSSKCRKAIKTFVQSCKQCGKQIRAYKSTEGRKHFCSRACYNISQRKPAAPKLPRQFRKEQRLCEQCGMSFMAFPSRTTKYCSRSCAGKANVKRQTGKRRRSVDIRCEYCGKLNHRYTSRTNSYDRAFCNATCFHAWDAIYKSTPEMIAKLSRRLISQSSISSLEDRVAAWFYAHGLEFERQVLLKVYTLDFRVGETYIEVQGCYWHGCTACNKELTPRQRQRIARDKSLTTYCRNRGIKLLCIWEHDLLRNDYSAIMPLLYMD